MATIDNIKELADNLLADAIENEELMGTDTPGVFSYQIGNEFVLVSNNDIDMSDSGAIAAHLEEGGLQASGEFTTSVIGNDLGNYIVGSDDNNRLEGGLGDDQINTGAGDDIVEGGEGNDTIILDDEDTGTKILSGGEGNDTFIIEASGEDSHTTITDFTQGDKLRWYADVDDDGQISIGDLVDLTKAIEQDGSTVLTLTDGTTVVLEGVTGFFLQKSEFEFGTDDDELYVDITFVDM